MPHLKMVIFTSKHCAACQHLKKNVLPQFRKANPDLTIEEVVTEEGIETNEARADGYGIQNVPTIVFEVEGLGRGGAPDCNLSGLTALFKRAQDALATAAKGGKK